MKQQDQVNYLQSQEQLFGQEREQIINEQQKVLDAWKRVAVSSEGEFIKDWLLKQILIPIGSDNSHTYFSGVQDTFKMILEHMKITQKGDK